LFLAVRLHWKLGAITALAAIAALAGIASASGLLGLEQTRGVAVACVNAGLTSNRAATPAEMYGAAAGDSTSKSTPAGARQRRRCESDKPTPSRGLSRHRAVSRPVKAPPAPPADAVVGVAPGSVASTDSLPAAGQLPGEPTLPAPDSTPPQTSISSGPPAVTRATTTTFAFSSSESGSTFQCKLDSGAWGACVSPKGYSSIAPGLHKFSVRAIDPAANVDPTPATQSWTVEGSSSVDTTPPQTSITAGPPAVTTSTSASFTLSSNESGSSFECQLDDGTWTPCETRDTYAGLDPGQHQFAARAIDPAENVDATPATRAWAIEEEVASPPPSEECTTVVSSAAAAESAVSSAPAGSVICMADGSYGEVSISASKSAQVTLRAEHPGKATIAGASLEGSHLTLSRFNVTNEVTVEPGAASMAIEYNRITGGYFGINAGPTTSTSISDTTIRGNKLVGPFGEDAIRLNRYHDSGDADPYGILIEGNEITGVRENGNHSDCLQSVWGGDGLYFRRNYLHDNRCQGFFVKDQPSTVVGINVEDNLFLRNSEPCAPEAPGCGQPAYLQVFGPYQNFTMRRNTIWQGEVVATFQEGAGTGTAFESNVVNRFWTNTDLSGIAYSENTVCKRETAPGGSWPAQTAGETVDCAPSFNNPVSDDFRLIGSTRGVDWAPAEQHFGP
jgi:hypothetical protein